MEEVNLQRSLGVGDGRTGSSGAWRREGGRGDGRRTPPRVPEEPEEHPWVGSETSAPVLSLSSPAPWDTIVSSPQSQRDGGSLISPDAAPAEENQEEVGTVWGHSEALSGARGQALRAGPWESREIALRGAAGCGQRVLGPRCGPAGEAVLTVGRLTEGKAMTYETDQRRRLKGTDKAKSEKARMTIVPPPLWCLF